MTERTADAGRGRDGAEHRGRRHAGSDAGDRNRPRLAPRPLDRPAVDAEAAAAFGRPDGGRRRLRPGAASARRRAQRSHVDRPAAAPPRCAGATAARPRTPAPRCSARPAPARPTQPDEPAPFWDPVRSRPVAQPRQPGRPRPARRRRAQPRRRRRAATGARLSLREVLFGAPGAADGRCRRSPPSRCSSARSAASSGRLTGRGRVPAHLARSPRITQAVTEAKERPPGSVADIAARTVPAVVSVEVKVGDQGGTGSGVVDRRRRLRAHQQPRRRRPPPTAPAPRSTRSSTTAPGCPRASSAGTPRPTSPW